MLKQLRIIPCLISFLMVLSGCRESTLKNLPVSSNIKDLPASSNVQTVPVSGIVTVNGKPLANIGVAFQPLSCARGAPDSSGFTDASGRYKLKAHCGNQSGAAVGKHRVIILLAPPQETVAGGPGSLSLSKIPDRYNKESRLVFEVPPEGTAEANFDLEIP